MTQGLRLAAGLGLGPSVLKPNPCRGDSKASGPRAVGASNGPRSISLKQNKKVPGWWKSWKPEALEAKLKRILIFQTSVLGFLGGGQLMFFADFHPENWGRFERAYFSKGVGWNHQLGPGFRGESSVVGKVWVNCWEMFYPSNQFMVLFFWGRTCCCFFFGGGIVLDRFGKIRCFYNCSDGFSRHLTNVSDFFWVDLSTFFRDLLYRSV